MCDYKKLYDLLDAHDIDIHDLFRCLEIDYSVITKIENKEIIATKYLKTIMQFFSVKLHEIIEFV